MNGHRLLVSLAIAILIGGSLVVGGCSATPDRPVTDEDPQTKDDESSEPDAAYISVGEDSEGSLWFGVVQIDGDGSYRIGTHGGDSVEVSFSEFGDLIVSEPRPSEEFDSLTLEAIDEAFGVWEKGMTTGGDPIAIDEGGVSKEE